MVVLLNGLFALGVEPIWAGFKALGIVPGKGSVNGGCEREFRQVSYDLDRLLLVAFDQLAGWTRGDGIVGDVWGAHSRRVGGHG